MGFAWASRCRNGHCRSKGLKGRVSRFGARRRRAVMAAPGFHGWAPAGKGPCPAHARDADAGRIRPVSSSFSWRRGRWMPLAAVAVFRRQNVPVCGREWPCSLLSISRFNHARSFAQAQPAPQVIPHSGEVLPGDPDSAPVLLGHGHQLVDGRRHAGQLFVRHSKD